MNGLVFQQLSSALEPLYGAPEARSMARIVLEDAFQMKAGAEKPLSDAQGQLLQQILQRLLRSEPLQYVLGRADFFGYQFEVNPAVLIPRQETEELVDWVLKTLRHHPEPRPVVLDVGLGSGCIAATLKARQPGIEIMGLEKSPEALEVARRNAARLLAGQRFDFRLGDVLDPAVWSTLPALDVVVSNPPYIPEAERALVPVHVRAHEPALALFVEDADPLIFYRTIAQLAQQHLKPGGYLFFECNEFNAATVQTMLEERAFRGVELRKDLSGAERMVRGQWVEEE